MLKSIIIHPGNTPSQHDNQTANDIVRPHQLFPEIIRDSTHLHALTPEWQALCDSMPLQTPFATPTWNLLWWQHLRATRRLIHDRLHVLVLRDHEGRLRAVAPMMISVRGGIGAGGIRVLQFFGADPNITEIRGVICRPEDADSALAEVQHHLRTHQRAWDWLEWQGLSAQQAAQLSARGARSAGTRVICYLPLPADWETLKSSLSRNMKEAIRKCFNTLRRNQHEHAFEVIEQADQLGPALETFFRLHKLRASVDDGVVHADVFRDEKSRRFLCDYVEAAAQRGEVRIFQFRIEGNVVSSRIGFLSQGQLYLYYSGYDTGWGAYSVMTTLVIHAIQWAIAQGCTGVNLSTGVDRSKQRWHPQELTLHNVIQICPRPLASLRFNSYTYLRSFHLLSQFSRKK